MYSRRPYPRGAWRRSLPAQSALDGRFSDRRPAVRAERIDDVTLRGKPALGQPGRPWGNHRHQICHNPQSGQYVIGPHGGGDLPYD